MLRSDLAPQALLRAVPHRERLSSFGDSSRAEAQCATTATPRQTLEPSSLKPAVVDGSLTHPSAPLRDRINGTRRNGHALPP